MSNVHGSKWIRPEKRLAIYLRDGFTCAYCLSDLSKADPFDVTLDHLIPRAVGGSNTSQNLVTACRRCNSSRGTKVWWLDLPNFARHHIETLVCQPLNLALAKAILDGTQDTMVAELEAGR